MKQQNLLSKVLKEFKNVDFSTAMELFSIYYQELLVWNKKINLISQQDVHRIVTRHFLESLGFLNIVDFPHQACVVDLGSGAGLPGIPIAIVRPDLDIVLVESKRKKAGFLRHISIKLDLENIRVIDKRMETVCDTIQPVDMIVCRSVASLLKLYKWSYKCLKASQGRLLTIKGEQYKKELHILLKQNRPDTKIEYEIKPYTPFSDIYVIRKCYMVILNIKKVNINSL